MSGGALNGEHSAGDIQRGHSAGGHSTSAGGHGPKMPPLATGLVATAKHCLSFSLSEFDDLNSQKLNILKNKYEFLRLTSMNFGNFYVLFTIIY